MNMSHDKRWTCEFIYHSTLWNHWFSLWYVKMGKFELKPHIPWRPGFRHVWAEHLRDLGAEVWNVRITHTWKHLGVSVWYFHRWCSFIRSGVVVPSQILVVIVIFIFIYTLYVQIDAEGKVPRKVSVTNMISKKSNVNGSNTDSPSLEIDEEEYHQTQSTNTICS